MSSMTDQRPQTLPALRTMQARPQWICWRKEPRRDTRDTYTKVPYDPRTGHEAKSNDPATWATYTEALTTWQQAPERYDGIGYMFHRDLTGVDLDHCIDAQGQMEPWAWAIVKRLASYAEYSPSETGVHILIRGTVPKGIRRFIKKALPQLHPQHPDAAIEMYCEGRYFTVTGNHVEGAPTTIEAKQEALETLYAEVVGRCAPPASPPKPQEAAPPSLDDETLLKKAGEANNGAKFRALFYQGSAGYPSASEADLALCLMLAFWTGRDPERMDRLFRRSTLYREKWDTARSTNTYGQDTIQKAAALCRVVYDPERNRKQVERDIDQVFEQVAHQQEKLSTKKRKPYQLVPKEVPTAKVLRYLEENEYGDARFFAEAFAGQVCYDHTAKEWYLWDGHAWKLDATGKVRKLVAGVLGTLYLRAAADLNTEQAELDLKIQAFFNQGEKDTADSASMKIRLKELTSQVSTLRARAHALRTAKRMNNVLTFVQAELGITSEIWDTNPWLLAVPNGVLDLHTGECRDGNPTDYIRTVCPTEWAGLEMSCARFEHFLEEVFDDKPDREALIAFVHRLLGYSITGLTLHALFPILYGGEGRNGKDTLLDTLKSVLGPLVGAVSNDVFIAHEKVHSGGAATPHLCDLQGKRLVWGSETKEGDRLNISQIKLLTGGGDISARQLHGHQYTFSPTHKLLLMTNYKPHADARDKAFWARACLIEFSMRFIDQPQAPHERKADLTLKEALRQERAGILAWLVRGCLNWQKQGLEIPASVQLATDKYREEEDRLFLFIQECCVVLPLARVQPSALFKAYRDWYEANQFSGRGMNGKQFADELGKRFERGRSKTGRYYLGIGLLTPEGTPQPALFDEERGDTSMEPATPRARPYERPPEATPGTIERGEGDTQDSNFQVFSKNEKRGDIYRNYIGGGVSPVTPSPPVIIPQSASEDIPGHKDANTSEILDVSPVQYPQPCTTKWEKRRQVAHEAVATHFSAGCYWCEKCEPQRVWMEFGEAKNYPHIDVPAHRFQVRQGREYWLQFAQEAGYTLVRYALEAARQPESFEL
jgi:putative DNA primase/helicase